jgi:probable rRNA maturation factor
MEARGRVRSIDLRGLPPRLGRIKRPIELAARAVLRAHSVKSYALSITFVSDRRIAGINRRALGKNGATDVIAFDLSEAGLPSGVVGDIYVSLGRARASSRAFKVSESEEIIRLVVHGVLHVVGYRDATAASRRKMESVQEQVVKRVRRGGRAANGSPKR